MPRERRQLAGLPAARLGEGALHFRDEPRERDAEKRGRQRLQFGQAAAQELYAAVRLQLHRGLVVPGRDLDQPLEQEAHLAVFAAPLPGKALLKGTRIASPFADSPEVILRVVEELVPPADELGPLPLRPAELRERLGAS